MRTQERLFQTLLCSDRGLAQCCSQQTQTHKLERFKESSSWSFLSELFCFVCLFYCSFCSAWWWSKHHLEGQTAQSQSIFSHYFMQKSTVSRGKLETLKKKKQSGWISLLRVMVGELQTIQGELVLVLHRTFSHQIQEKQSLLQFFCEFSRELYFCSLTKPWLKLFSELRSNYQSHFKMSITPLLVKNLCSGRKKKSVQIYIQQVLYYKCFKSFLFP